jgi:hypothetical protein
MSRLLGPSGLRGSGETSIAERQGFWHGSQIGDSETHRAGHDVRTCHITAGHEAHCDHLPKSSLRQLIRERGRSGVR